jgi:hypothetical protein
MNYYNYPFNPMFQNTQQQQFINGGNYYYVNSKQEAENWIVNPDSTVFLLDRTNKKFYIKTVEKSGLAKPLEVYSYEQTETIDKPSEYATKDDLEDLRKELKELRNESITNGIADQTESEPITADIVPTGENQPGTI